MLRYFFFFFFFFNNAATPEFSPLPLHAALPISPYSPLKALAKGPTAAGLSGKGPAEVALVPDDLVRRFQKAFPRIRLVALGGLP